MKIVTLVVIMVVETEVTVLTVVKFCCHISDSNDQYNGSENCHVSDISETSDIYDTYEIVK